MLDADGAALSWRVRGHFDKLVGSDGFFELNRDSWVSVLVVGDYDDDDDEDAFFFFFVFRRWVAETFIDR